MHSSLIVRAPQNTNRQAQQRNNESQLHPISNKASILRFTDHNTKSEKCEIETDPLHAQQDSPTHGGRNLQNVIPNIFWYQIVKWMTENALSNGKKRLISRTVKEFPQHFRSFYNANIMRASLYWNIFHQIMSRPQSGTHPDYLAFTSTCSRVRRHFTKTRYGRGRKRLHWDLVPQDMLCAEFDRPQKTGLRFKSRFLRLVALDIITNSDLLLRNNIAVDPERIVLIKKLVRTISSAIFMK